MRWVMICLSQRFGSRNAAQDNPRPNILQLNAEGLTANKISVLEGLLAYNNEAFIIALKESYSTSADKLVIPNFSLAASVLSKNHNLATFVHEWLEWSLIDQSLEQSETEWLRIDVARYKISNIYKPQLSLFTPMVIPTFPHPSLHVVDFNCQHVNWGYKKTTPWRWEPGFLILGNIQQPRSVVWSKGNSQFFLSPSPSGDWLS